MSYSFKRQNIELQLLRIFKKLQISLIKNQAKYGSIKSPNFTIDQQNHRCRIKIQKFIQHNEGKSVVAKMFIRNLKVAYSSFRSVTMFKQQSLSFYIISKTFITKNYISVIPNNILRFTFPNNFCLAHFETSDNWSKHNFEKHYCCGNYSDDIYQCPKTDQILLKI